MRSIYLGELLDNNSTNNTCKYLHRCYLISSALTLNDLENCKANAMYSGIPASPKLQFILYGHPFSSYRPLRQVHQMTQDDLQHYQIKHNPHMLYQNSQVSEFTPLRFARKLDISKISAIFYFPINHNVKIQSFFFFQFLQILISKFQEVTFVWAVTGNHKSYTQKKQHCESRIFGKIASALNAPK